MYVFLECVCVRVCACVCVLGVDCSIDSGPGNVGVIHEPRGADLFAAPPIPPNHHHHLHHLRSAALALHLSLPHLSKDSPMIG